MAANSLEAIYNDLYEGIAVNLQGLSASSGYSLVITAVDLNNFDIVRSLLDGGCPVNESETVYDSPLHFAVSNDSCEMVELLLENGAAANRINKSGETPLLRAVERRNSKMVELFLKHNAVVNVDLFHAIREGNLQETTRLIDSPEEIASFGLLGGYSPLRLAVDMDHVDIVKLLLDRGYPVNARETVSYCPLRFAAENGSCEMVELLLKNGADVNSRSNYGSTPLLRAVERRHFPIVELLLKYGADVNAEDFYKSTSLHCLSKAYLTFGSEAVISEISNLLLNKGANVNAQAFDGCTPLHESIKRNCYSLADLLLRCNADVNLVDGHGYTALHWTAEEEGREIAKRMGRLLLKWGADVNCKTETGRTVLHIAAEQSGGGFVKFLLENGAQVNCQDQKGEYPLHRASNPIIIDLLMKFGARIDCRSEDGRTPLHFMSSSDRSREVATLLEYGADINLKCNRGLTPLDWTHYDHHGHLLDEGTERTEIRDELLRHQARMEGVGLHVEESQFSARYEGRLEGFRKSCQEEVLLLRSEFIDGTSISFYNFARKDVRFLAKYVDNEDVMRAAEKEEYWSKYPLYDCMIISQFRRGLARNKLLKAAYPVLNQLIDLPDYCTEKIVDYLCDDELAVLINV